MHTKKCVLFRYTFSTHLYCTSNQLINFLCCCFIQVITMYRKT